MDRKTIRSLLQPPFQLEQVKGFYAEMEQELTNLDRNGIKNKIKSFVPEYTPYLD